VEAEGFEPSVPRKLPTAGIAPQSSRASITSRPETATTNLAALVLFWIRIDEQAVRRVGFQRPESRIEAEARRAIGAENRVLLAHVDVDVRVIVRRRNADTVEFPDADSDLRDRAVVPELRIAAAGHRFRPL
jgi:hypothetical protein